MDSNDRKLRPGSMARMVRLEEMDRSFDTEFWQKQGPEAIFAAAWQMVVDAAAWGGQDESELRLQRSVERIQRL